MARYIWVQSLKDAIFFIIHINLARKNRLFRCNNCKLNWSLNGFSTILLGCTTYYIPYMVWNLVPIYYIFSYFRQRKDAILNCQSTNSRIIFNLRHHVFKYFWGRITISKFLGYEINKTRAFEYFPTLISFIIFS